MKLALALWLLQQSVTGVATIPVASSSNAIPATFFNQNPEAPAYTNLAEFPSFNFYGLRLWDTHATWRDLEPNSGTFNWSNLDTDMAVAAVRHKDVLYTFGYVPNWISSNTGIKCASGNGCASPPKDLNSGDGSWKAFVTALVTRYKGRIATYELWNEPDRTDLYWNGTATQFAIMAKDAAAIIRQIDPAAKIVSPAISTTANISWLSSYLAAAGIATQDIIGYHEYDSSAGAVPGNVAKIKALAQGLPMWMTEGSWGGNQFSAAQQTAFVNAYLPALWKAGVTRSYWYSYDNSNRGTLWTSGGGLNAGGIAYKALSGASQ